MDSVLEKQVRELLDKQAIREVVLRLDEVTEVVHGIGTHTGVRSRQDPVYGVRLAVIP